MRSKNRNRVIRNIHTDGKGLRRSRLLHLGCKVLAISAFRHATVDILVHLRIHVHTTIPDIANCDYTKSTCRYVDC